MIDHCPNCKSPDLAKGVWTTGPSLLTRNVIFQPGALNLRTITSTAGAPVEGYACLSCGLVWAATDPKALRTVMEKYREKE